MLPAAAQPDLDLADLADLAVLGGPVIENPDVLEKIFSYLNPASVMAVSLVSR